MFKSVILCALEKIAFHSVLYLYSWKAPIPVIIRVKDGEQKEQATKAFRGQCLYRTISP